jgi:hypothetical protein
MSVTLAGDRWVSHMRNSRLAIAFVAYAKFPDGDLWRKYFGVCAG